MGSYNAINAVAIEHAVNENDCGLNFRMRPMPEALRPLSRILSS